MALHLIHFQPDQTVVDENVAALLHVVNQSGVRNGRPVLVADDLVRRQNEPVAPLQRHLSVFEIPKPDLRSLCVQQRRGRHIHRDPDAAEPLEFCLVFLMRAVGKIEAGDVHSRQNQRLQLLLALTRRTDRADNLRSAHLSSPFSFTDFIEDGVSFIIPRIRTGVIIRLSSARRENKKPRRESAEFSSAALQ